MTRSPLPTDNWHLEVPGARWFKADLHVHTIDDRAGGRAKMPDGLSGDLEDPEVLTQYARRFLQRVVERGVQVVGLTPHSPRVAPEASAVWRIVEEWSSGAADDGIPFRERIYAIFPGFEPALKDGREGLHLLFLFDPEIGRDCYLRVFDLAMGGVSPWRDETLQISNKTTDQVFSDVRQLYARECHVGANGRRAWEYLVLAPHIDAPKGLLGAQKAQVLALFNHGEVAGLELGDGKLPEETLNDREWLRKGMEKHHQDFFHASDAYSPSEIGHRYSWVKLASPRIEALRQAFIASDSRMRIAFHRNSQGELEPVVDPPDVTRTERPWLRTVTVEGEASFFGGEDEGAPETFQFSPDLTCIIGGSMTGKSTLLDGLRVHTGARLPDEESILEQVKARGRDRFLAGSPEVTLDCPGGDPTASPQERWPAVFFAQNELQHLSRKDAAVESILARLVPAETEGIESRDAKLSDLDEQLGKLARRLAELNERASDATQAEERARRAKEELATFAEAGVEGLHRASGTSRAWEKGQREGTELLGELDRFLETATGFETPEIDGDLAEALLRADLDPRALAPRWEQMIERLREARRELSTWSEEARQISDLARRREGELSVEVERRLAARGLDANRLKEFQALHQQAALLTSYKANRKEVAENLAATERKFDQLRRERHDLVAEQRQAFDRVISQIERDFEGRILARRTECGRTGSLEGFLHGLAQKGVTRWWNEVGEDRRPSPENLLDAMERDELGVWRMSSAVQATFRESMTKARRWALAAIRCPDRYHVEHRLEDGSTRRLDQLSGGQQVSVLLSLLLETADVRPLVIDQPEDQLDSRFLFATVLPALKKFKGRRQVIVATHDANIVVNGDADMVIQLEATAHHGRIACSGAIEEQDVRDAIVRTVDGGEDAFRLRRLKYGF